MNRNSSRRTLSAGTLPLALDDSSPSSSSSAMEEQPSSAASTNRGNNPRRPDRRVSSINNLAAIAAANRSASRINRTSSNSRANSNASISSLASANLARDNSSHSLNFADALSAVQDEFKDIDEDEEFDIDPHSRAFTDAIHNAGTHAFGINAIDVWLLDEDDGSFHHAPGGWWRHYTYKGQNATEQRALARIEDVTRNDFVPPSLQIPGAGLAGYFWGTDEMAGAN